MPNKKVELNVDTISESEYQLPRASNNVPCVAEVNMSIEVENKGEASDPPFKICSPYVIDSADMSGKVKGLFIGIGYMNNYQNKKNCDIQAPVTVQFANPDPLHEQRSANSKWGPLQGTKNDIYAFIDTLKQLKVPLKEAVILIEDPEYEFNCGPPTKKNIIDAIKWLLADTKEGDTLLLYYAGHGEKRSRPLTPRGIVPPEEREKSITEEELFELCAVPLPTGARLTAFFDSCESGTTLNLPYNAVLKNDGTYDFKEYKQVEVKGDILVFSGCDDGQSSYEDHGRGKFSLGVEATLRKQQPLSILEFYREVHRTVSMDYPKQVPQLSCSKPFDLHIPFHLLRALPY